MPQGREGVAGSPFNVSLTRIHTNKQTSVLTLCRGRPGSAPALISWSGRGWTWAGGWAVVGLLFWSATGRAAVGAFASTLCAATPTARTGAWAAPAARTTSAPTASSLAILEQLDLASVKFCPVQLFNGALHVTVRSKLDHPLILFAPVCIHKGHFSDFPHQVLQILQEKHAFNVTLTNANQWPTHCSFSIHTLKYTPHSAASAQKAPHIHS